jgi:CelD/BcsL family acetyltransferase involved in cellulose biosynthesis
MVHSAMMRWELQYGFEAVERSEQAWNELAHAGSLSPVADALWMKCFWRAFAGRDETLAVHALYDRDKLVALLPLRPQKSFARAWQSITNDHSPYWMFAFERDHPEVAGEIIRHLLHGADAIDLGPIHRKGPIYAMLTDAARELGLRTITKDEGVDMFIDVSTPDALKASLSSNIRGDTGRKKRRLESLGELRFETLTSGPALRSTLEACFTLEAKSWKREAGSAVLIDPKAQLFYPELASEMAKHGRFALYLLYLGGRLIAYEFSLRAQGKIDMLKPSFEPDLAQYSPGNVLRLMLLESEAEKGEINSYHLGGAQPYKHRWARQVDELCRLHILAPGIRPGLAYDLGPRTLKALKSNATLRRLVKSLRKQGD